jgi:hypothetical protein
MENLVLNSVNGGKSGSDASPKDFNISVYASKAGASLNLINVSAASLSLIQGVKTQANVSIQKEERAAQYLKTGFTKVGSLSLTNTDLTTAKGSSVTNLNLTNSGWNALGATTITNILKADENSYLATKQTKDKKGNLYPQLTVSGSVNGTVVCKVMPVTASANEITYLTAYKDVKLLKALKASAEHFTAETEEITDEDRIIYKDTSGYVMIGDRNEMTAKITDASGMSTYAKSYKDAVTIIDNQNDSKSAYEIELLRFGVIRTGAGGTSYGELALPSKAAQVTIKGYTGDEDARSEIHYTGTLKPKCAVAFENVVLTEGTLSKKGVYTPTYQITPVLGKVSVTFKEGTTTLKRANVTAGSDEAEADLVFASASASKGVLSIQGRKIYCKGKFVVPELRLSGENELIGAQAITLTNLSDTGSGAELLVDTRFTATAKSSQKSVTQLTVKGSIGSGVTLGIAPRMYDRSTKSYHKMTLAEADSKNVRSASPSAVQKLAVMGKASAEKISVYYADGENTWKKLSSLKVSGADRAVRLFKYDSGLYLTTQDAAVRVSGSQSDGQQIYEAEFLTWAQAVSEIDRIANTGISYEIELLKNIGDVSASQSPLGTLSLPTKVKKIRIYSEGDPFCLFFTGTTVTLRSNTTFENVGLIAVKKYSSKSRVWYSAVSFTINAGNYPLTQKQMAVGSGSYLSSPSKITGSTKSTYEFASGEDHTKYRTAPADQISGFGTITIDDDAQIPKSLSGTTKLVLKEGAELVSTSGSIAFKDLILGAGAKIEAKSITGSGTAYLNGGCLSVSSSTGKCTLTNVVLGAEGNRLESRQDKNGGSPLEITGTVKKADGLTGTYTLAIGLYYNNGTQYAQLHNGMTLLTAAKAEASWFIPLYTVVREEGTSAGMGQQHEGYGTWKSGKLIKYGECL